MTNQMHLAAQYLAAAGISFLEKKEDDSHTNLGFSVESARLSTRPLNDAGDRLSLNYKDFILEWNTYRSSTSFGLDGSSHAEVLEWIKQMSANANIGAPYAYSFHYDLPYKITDDFTFKLSNPTQLRMSMHFRILAQNVLEAFLEDKQLNSDIRVWPHHLDTGAFALLENGSGLSVSLGLAIPDTLCNDYYFYISGYQGHKALDVSSFPELAIGEWYNEDFNGAILPATNTNEITAFTFLEDALKVYKTWSDDGLKNQISYIKKDK